MPVYFFEIEEDSITQVDTVGTDLDDLLSAKVAAMELIPDLANAMMSERDNFTIEVRIRDSTRSNLLTATLIVSGPKV